MGPGETMVTNYCEWPDIPEFARPHFPIVPLSMLEKSVDNLAALLARRSSSARLTRPQKSFWRPSAGLEPATRD